MVNIIGYEQVTVGTEVIEQPIYDEPVIIVGSGDKQIVVSVAEYETELAEIEAAAALEIAPEPPIALNIPLE